MKVQKSTIAKNVNAELLNKLTALSITENLKEKSAKKSIFKKEFNNKQDRTKCRSMFLNAVQLFLLNTAHNKTELAKEQLNKIVECAKKYYLAEDKFLSASDYYTENLGEDKKGAIKLFIELMQKNAPKKVKKEKGAIVSKTKKNVLNDVKIVLDDSAIIAE